MNAPSENECLGAFRNHGVEPPLQYAWLLRHRTLGFNDFSQLEHWQFCSVSEILPLSKRWPDAGIRKLLIPFARQRGSDDLACFEFENGKAISVWHIHYNLGKPVYVEFCKEHPTVWDWLHAAVEDFKFHFELGRKTESKKQAQ